LVLIVICACEGVSLQSVRKSKIIITVGCLIYLAVVFWECFLVLTQINGVPVPLDNVSPNVITTLRMLTLP
jgi:hypothetical protein